MTAPRAERRSHDAFLRNIVNKVRKNRAADRSAISDGLRLSFQPFVRSGRHRYFFEKRCVQEPELAPEDGVMTVILSTKGLLYMIRMTRALVRQGNRTEMIKNLPEEDAEITGKIAGLILENENLSDEEILKKIGV